MAPADGFILLLPMVFVGTGLTCASVSVPQAQRMAVMKTHAVSNRGDALKSTKIFYCTDANVTWVFRAKKPRQKT